VLGSCLYISIGVLFVRCYFVLVFILFLVVLRWIVIECCEFVILYEVIYFMFVFLLYK
jgi:hypothetical protein